MQILLLFLACGGNPEPTTPVSPPEPTTSTTCTCRDAFIEVAVTLDGTPTEPTSIEVSLGNATSGDTSSDTGLGFALVGDVCTNPCADGAYRLDFVDDVCTMRVTMGTATQVQRCEDHLLPQEPCVCGRDVGLEFAFSSTTTN